jgi:polysaccharide biosynthesis/export protein
LLVKKKIYLCKYFFKSNLIAVNKIILYICCLLVLASCGTYKQVVYLQDAGHPVNLSDTTQAPIPDAILKVGDLLTITVNATTPEAALPFNLPLIPRSEELNSYSNTNITATGAGNGSLQNYLVDTHGDIAFPIVGKIHAAGMSKSALSEYIKDQIHPRYIKEDPIVSIRFANYKISVVGEVNKPGMFSIDNEKVTVFEAIAMASDLTIYGKRDNVLLIRENNKGKRETLRLDLRDARIINSPYYYMQQNDVLYVQPNNPKARSSGFSTAETLSISIIGTLISLASLVVTLSKK